MKAKRIFFSLLAAAGVAAVLSSAPARAAVLNDYRMQEVDCAGKKMQLFYFYFDPNRDKTINDYAFKCNGRDLRYKVPPWLEDKLPSMLAKKVWRDPVDGDLSEANLWQTPVSLLYSFCDITRKTFPPTMEGGQGIQPGLLVKEYADIRVRFQMSLDRLYRAREHNALDGRGRAMLAYFDLIHRQMESVADSLSSNNPQRFSDSVFSIATLGENAFSQLFQPPRQAEEKYTESAVDRALPLALKILGMLIIFFGVRRILGRDEEGINKLLDDYMKRVVQWTDDFNRQFLKVKVQYLVLVPIGVFALGGLLTFSAPGFLVLTAGGFYVGLHMPAWTLDFLKTRRGKKIDTQLMDALILLSNSLKSGLDIVQGFELVSRDLQPPIAEEFGLVIKNYQLGTAFERALEGMEARVSSRLLAYMIRAISLQRQVGGNLTKIFERIVDNIREEGKLEEKTKALTAQQKIQSIVVGLMPWVMLLVMFVFQGEAMRTFYFSPVGATVLFFCAMWIAIGMKVVQKLGDIKV